MVNGNALLPEDISTIIVKFSSSTYGGAQGGGAPGLWGTALGDELRQWMIKHGRPLLWADRADGKTRECCWHLGCILPQERRQQSCGQGRCSSTRSSRRSCRTSHTAR